MKNKTNKYIEKKIRKYVIANMDGRYLKRSVEKNGYCFVEDIEVATKTINYKTMEDVIKYFYHDTGMTDLALVIIPIEITYELIDENN